MRDMSEPETHRRVAPRPAGTAPGEVAQSAAAPRRILIAEDDPQMLRFVSEALRRAGYLVVEAHSGGDLIRRLTDWVLYPDCGPAFDLVISDHRMPGFSGLEVLEGFRSLTAAPPFIMITAFGGDEFADEASRAGARAVLDKPFLVRDLLELVLNLIGPAQP